MRKRDLRSAVCRFADLLETTPARLPANIRQLKLLVINIHPAQNDLNAKTLQNIKSNLLAAVRHFLATGNPIRRRKKLSSKWQCIYSQLPNKRFNSGLSRFVRFNSDRLIEPGEVNDETINTFIQELTDNSFIPDKKRNDIHRCTTRLWNEVSDIVADWPDIKLTVPDHRKPRTSHPLVDFPIAFQEDVIAYLIWLEDKDVLAEDKPPCRCKPRTIDLRRSQIQLAASALVMRGRNIDKIKSLTDLVDVEAVKDILRHYLNKNGDEPTSFIQGLAITLIAIAQYWVKVPGDQLTKIKKIKRQLGGLRVGMTDKNRHMLRQFDDDHNHQLLLQLPDQLIQLAAKQPAAKAAITTQKAIAIEMLIMAPIRVASLISLRFDRHLIKPGGNRGQYHLVLPEHETKNGQPYEVRLPTLLSQYIDRYRTQLLPAITTAPNPYLFPNKLTGHKAQETLSQQIKETIKKYTGLNLTGHQFRHLSGKFFLEENPGQYESVRQLLGHKHIKTTVAFYTGLNTKEATRVFDDLILEKRNRLSEKSNNSSARDDES
jgi:integrase